MVENKIMIVTGCAGLLGSNISKRLLQEGYFVIGIDNLFSGYKKNIPEHANFQLINKDLLNRDSILKLITDGKNLKLIPDSDIVGIIHCAALPYEGVSVFAPYLINKNIVSATTAAASLAIKLEIPYFINFSSMARYGNQHTPFYETDPTMGVDPYGLSKIHAEEQLNLLSDIHGLKVFHVVPHNVSGVGQIFTDPFRNVLSIFINRHLHDKPPIVYGDGLQMRSFSHVDDCVNAVMKLWQYKDTFDSREVFNIGPDDGTEITVRQLASIVADVMGKKDEVIHLPDRPCEVKNAWVSINKAKELLGYKITKSVTATVEETAAWIKSQPLQDFNYHLELEFVKDNTPKTWTEKLI